MERPSNDSYLWIKRYKNQIFSFIIYSDYNLRCYLTIVQRLIII